MRNMRFFSTLPPSNRSILDGIYNYNETFSSFVKGTHQKRDTALVMGVFAKKLREKQVSLFKQQFVKVADLGCANSATGIQYLTSMNYPPGFHYFGIDTNRTFIKEAEAMLLAEPLIKKHTLIHGNALGGNLKEKKELASELFDFIFISHTAYYLTDELACRAFLVDIMKLLSECGIAIFLHENSTCYFRSTYNRNQFNKISTPMFLEQSARTLNTSFNQFESICFTSKLKFSPMNGELWEAMKHPESYKRFSRVPNFIETLEKLAFIVQRELTGMAQEGSLSDYIDDIREAITTNNNCFDLKTHMQTMVGPKCVLRHKIARALSETQEEIGRTIFISDEARNSEAPQLAYS